MTEQEDRASFLIGNALANLRDAGADPFDAARDIVEALIELMEERFEREERGDA